MNLLIEQSFDPRHNLAREELLLSKADTDTLYLWRNRPSVIIGRNQNTLAEVDEEAARKEDIRIVRRITGGGAVFQDLGNINFSYVFPRGDSEEKSREAIRMILEFIQKTGADCYLSGRNDIYLLDRTGREVKIGGTAMTCREEGGIFHACLLFDTYLSQLSRVLTPSREKLQSKGISSVRGRVSNLRKETERLSNLSSDEFFALWADELKKSCTVIEQVCTEEDVSIQKLIEEKYGNDQWNFGKNPRCNLKNICRFPAGTAEVYLEVSGGKIRQCVCRGDYFCTEEFLALENSMRGISFDKKEIEKALRDIDTETLFGTADYEGIVNFLLCRK